jgi:hypothetical protein
MPQLIRDGDGEGYAGSRVQVINPEEKTVESFNGDPATLIGNMLLVGTVTAGMFTDRDWWRTNVITDIISEDDDEIRFNTESGSTYTFRKHYRGLTIGGENESNS